jgi:hypothetical protein
VPVEQDTQLEEATESEKDPARQFEQNVEEDIENENQLPYIFLNEN